MGPGPPKSKFDFFDLAATSCTLAYIFLCILIEGMMAHDVQNARKIDFKQAPKLGGSKFFWGMTLFEFAPFEQVILPILQERIMGLSTPTRTVFIPRESLFILLRYRTSKLQLARLRVFSRF